MAIFINIFLTNIARKLKDFVIFLRLRVLRGGRHFAKELLSFKTKAKKKKKHRRLSVSNKNKHCTYLPTKFS